MRGKTSRRGPDRLKRLAKAPPVVFREVDGQLFHEDLVCYVQGITYSFQTRVGRIVMGDHSCTDMTGAIAMFLAIDPEAVQVQTQRADGGLDAIYTRDPSGEWEARLYERHHAKAAA